MTRRYRAPGMAVAASGLLVLAASLVALFLIRTMGGPRPDALTALGDGIVLAATAMIFAWGAAAGLGLIVTGIALGVDVRSGTRARVPQDVAVAKK